MLTNILIYLRLLTFSELILDIYLVPSCRVRLPICSYHSIHNKFDHIGHNLPWKIMFSVRSLGSASSSNHSFWRSEGQVSILFHPLTLAASFLVIHHPGLGDCRPTALMDAMFGSSPQRWGPWQSISGLAFWKGYLPNMRGDIKTLQHRNWCKIIGNWSNYSFFDAFARFLRIFRKSPKSQILRSFLLFKIDLPKF